MEYKCEQCNKQYASYNSLWNHNKRLHNISVKANVKDCKGKNQL